MENSAENTNTQVDLSICKDLLIQKIGLIEREGIKDDERASEMLMYLLEATSFDTIKPFISEEDRLFVYELKNRGASYLEKQLANKINEIHFLRNEEQSKQDIEEIKEIIEKLKTLEFHLLLDQKESNLLHNAQEVLSSIESEH